LIEIPRALIRTFRGIVRQSLLIESPRDGSLPVQLHAGRDGFTLQACRGNRAVGYHVSQQQPTLDAAVRLSDLMELEGSGTDRAVLDRSADAVRARWHSAGVPRTTEFALVAQDRLSAFPELPAEMTPLPATFVAALGEAARAVAESSTRYALAAVCLRGARGQVVATDGRHLLVQGGFPLPWSEDLLVPRVPAFACKPLLEADPVAVGRTASHVAVTAGPWTFALAIDADARYPDVDCVIPRRLGTRLALHADDVAFLQEVLPNLPGDQEENAAITLDLASPPALRAREGTDGPATEVQLTQSSVSGPALAIVMNRAYLQRAVRLGFCELLFASPDKPIVVRDEKRTYLWMPLSAASAILPGPNVACITSWPTNGVDVPATSKPPRRISPMADRSADAAPPAPPARNGSTERMPTLDDLFAEAEAIRALLQEVHTRLTRLGGGLKALRKHGRALQAVRT